jgi:hypothetical protein
MVCSRAAIICSNQQYSRQRHDADTGCGKILSFLYHPNKPACAICLTARAIDPSPGNFFSRPSILASTAVYISIVGLIYNIVLRKLWLPIGDQKLADEVLHVIVPVLYVAYWLLFAPKYYLQWKDTFIWLCYPAAYVVYAIVRGAIEGFYPYPFINLNEQSATKVLMNIAVLLLIFFTIGFIFIWVAKKMTRKKSIA